jgi:hypothetical protein
MLVTRAPVSGSPNTASRPLNPVVSHYALLMSLDRALDLLEAGDWKRAHEIVQEDSSALAAWLHGIVHTLEGDLDNARYWYRKAKREFPGASLVKQEIASARRAADDERAGRSGKG